MIEQLTTQSKVQLLMEIGGIKKARKAKGEENIERIWVDS